MPNIFIGCTDAQKELWVRASHEEYLSLSEWVRRALDARAGLGAGDVGGLPRDAGPTRSSASPSAAPAPSPSPGDDTVTPGTKAGLVSSQGSFRPDPKVKK